MALSDLIWEDGCHDMELTAYQLLHQLRGRCIPRLFGVVCPCITPGLPPLHPITNIVQGLVLQYIHDVNIEKLRPSVDVSAGG